MVQEAGHGHALLLAAAEHVFPFLAAVPAAFARGDGAEADFVQNALQLGVAAPGVAHVHFRVRINDLVAEGADAEVGPLREEHDAIGADGARPTN